ncbi:MAG: hypothetical protein KME30_14075 [Iphinoe sp. HA4291-MV1]|jgi:hypothetical protein|nr:hypothetical protein [Iphinoe sp. HA4291-MV1]
MNNPFISYNYAISHNLPPYSQKLQEYWLAADGVYVRAHRLELEICLQIAHTQVPGLTQIQPYFKLNVPKVPASIIADIINAARVNPHQEILFYLGVENNIWWYHIPLQEASSTHVRWAKPRLRPLGDARGERAACRRQGRSLLTTNFKYSQALVEVHSHGCMKATPSCQDNQEESGKFRIFGIIGTVNTTPTIYTRLGAYNHFFEIDPNFIFES